MYLDLARSSCHEPSRRSCSAATDCARKRPSGLKKLAVAARKRNWTKNTVSHAWVPPGETGAVDAPRIRA